MDPCANLTNCGFAKKFADNSEIKEFIPKYCYTELQNECKRKEYKKTTGTAPSDDMLPDGSMYKE